MWDLEEGGALPSSVKLAVKNVSLVYNNVATNRQTWALNDISLEVYDQEFICIVGPSGCGKTTFLNIIDGLIKPTKGNIFVDGKAINGPGPDREMVFQDACLLPWRTVFDNVKYGLEIRKTPRNIVQERCQKYIELVGLQGFEHRYPYELSGGMQQRVNVARALACDPEVLLLDEPFASLDAQTREFMQVELLKIWAYNKKTAVFITHQINEAIFLSDRIFVFGARPGRLKEIINIDLPRPRTLKLKRDTKFLAYEDRIWILIEEEARATGMLLAEDS